MVRAREWLAPRGGCLGIPSWGKFWLTVLNVYQWEGVHSLFPEMVLLPTWFPLHTHRMWSYCRTVYMPMTFLYGWFDRSSRWYCLLVLVPAHTLLVVVFVC
jgi:lanosterol synthase